MNSSSLRVASQSCINKAIIAFHHGMPRTARYRIRLCRWASVGSHTFPSHEVVRCCPKQMRHLVRVGILAGRPDGFEYHKDIGYRYSADGSGMGAKVVPRFPRLYASTAFAADLQTSMNLIADVEIRRPTSSMVLGGSLERQMCSLTGVLSSACNRDGWEETILPQAVEAYNRGKRGTTLAPTPLT